MARIGIIGAGARMLMLLRLLQERHNRIEIAAAYDPSDASINALEAAMHRPIERCASVDQLVNRIDLDWVLVGSWNACHAGHTIAALNAGKHVFCEKPMATSLQDCLAVREAQARSGRMVSVGFVLRYSPHFVRIKQLLQDGRIGQVISLEANETLTYTHGGYFLSDWRRLRSQGGPALLEKCCHDIDLINWFIDAPVLRVASFGGLAFFTPTNAHRMEQIPPDDQGRPAYLGWPSTTGLDPFHADKDIEDHQVVLLEYGNGVKATFHLNCNAAIPERRLYLLGTEGTLRADVLKGTIESARIGPTEAVRNDTTGVSGGHGGGDTVLVDDLASSMLHNTPPRTSVREGLNATAVCLAIDRAMLEHRVVNMAEIWPD